MSLLSDQPGRNTRYDTRDSSRGRDTAIEFNGEGGGDRSSSYTMQFGGSVSVSKDV